MAIRSFDNDGSDEFDRFAGFDRDLFTGMERMFDRMRSMYGIDGRWMDGEMDGIRGGEWSDARRLGSWGDAATSLKRQDGEFVFVMDLPGFEREDIDLTFGDGRLSVDAVHEADDDSTHRSRRMRNSVRIPADVVEEDVSASYRNGVLEVHLPIVEDDVDDGRHIDIQG